MKQGTKKSRKCLLGGGYIINEEKSYCEVNGSKDTEAKLFTNDSGQHVIENLQKNSKCWLYFIGGKTMETILTGYNIGTRGEFNGSYSVVHTKTIFTASDDYGTSKYFAGRPLDNYVKFGGFYWRIIRMNGNKTTRLIYAGDASVIDGLSNKQAVLANGYNDGTTQYTQIKKSAFNLPRDDNAYVGFKYEVGSLRGTTNKSTILEVLDTWYETNLKTSYGKYLDGSTGFCGDRTPYTDNSGSTSGGGIGSTQTIYGASIRRENKSPVLTCANISDLYTTSDSSLGNKSLVNPIGLLTADEGFYAGNLSGTPNNATTFLRTFYGYWTMTPLGYSSFSSTFFIDNNGYTTGGTGVSYELGVRPVINLASTTRFTGTGTWDDPFTVVY